VLQSVAECCRGLQCVAACCRELQCVAVYHDTLKIVCGDIELTTPNLAMRVCCSVLQCVAASCYVLVSVMSHIKWGKLTTKFGGVCVLQCVAVCFRVFQSIAVCRATCRMGEAHHQLQQCECVAVCCTVLQRVAVCCSVLQCVTVCHVTHKIGEAHP